MIDGRQMIYCLKHNYQADERENMAEKVLILDNIIKKYQDGSEERSVLDGINLEIEKGEFYAVCGPSGSGKTTFLSIAGLLLSADSGSIRLCSEEVSGKSQRELTKLRRKHIGFIFQNHQLLPYLNAFDQIEMFQMPEKRSSISVNDLMEELGIDECRKRYPDKMSGGERQRTAIARALINDPDIVLADEPTASLDADRGRQVVKLIADIVKSRNKAAIMVTHDERVLDLADRVFMLKDGKLINQEKIMYGKSIRDNVW